MCEANVFIKVGGKEELFLDSVDKLIPQGEEIYLETIFGQRKTLKGRIVEMGLLDYRIVLERQDG